MSRATGGLSSRVQAPRTDKTVRATRCTGWKPVPRKAWLGRLAQAAYGSDRRV
ncbi:MAG: hypothetical protein NZ556_01505 [Fimbriimonadales bacterium]|nr:hypothetical protein [Fimbriimonadales bacterium]